MANFIKYDSIKKNKKYFEPITKYGYNIVPIYGKQNVDESIMSWIENNINGDWTTFSFVAPEDGQGYCFLEELDTVAFKLRWL